MNSIPTVATMGTLCEQIRGVTYTKHDAREQPFDGLVPILRANNILEDGRLAFDDLVYVPRDVVSDSQMLRKHDIVVATSSGSLDVVGKAAQAKVDWTGAFGAFCKVLRPRKGVDPRYLAYYFRTTNYRQRISHLAAGANINNLRNEHLDELEVPLPPLPEQRRIADILDKADAVRRKRGEAALLVSDLPLSLFFDGFFSRKSQKADSKSLSAIAQVVSGVTKGRRFNGAPTRIVPYLRVANVQAGYLDMQEIKTIEALESEIPVLALQHGDVVMTEGGDFDKLGRGAIWQLDIPDCIHQNHVFRVRVNRNEILPEYFATFLLTPVAKAYFLRCAKKTSNLASINITQLKGLPVPVPSQQAQKAFVNELRKQSMLHAKSTAHIRQSDDLFNSLVQRAFRGEL